MRKIKKEKKKYFKIYFFNLLNWYLDRTILWPWLHSPQHCWLHSAQCTQHCTVCPQATALHMSTTWFAQGHKPILPTDHSTAHEHILILTWPHTNLSTPTFNAYAHTTISFILFFYAKFYFIEVITLINNLIYIISTHLYYSDIN